MKANLTRKQKPKAKSGCFFRWTMARNDYLYMWRVSGINYMECDNDATRHTVRILFCIPHLKNKTRDLQYTHAHESSTQLFHCD